MRTAHSNRRLSAVLRALMLTTCACLSVPGAAQQAFQNLDFEGPILPLQPENFHVPISQAMPGWGARVVLTNGSRYELDSVIFNTTSLSGLAVSFHDRSSITPILQGSYSAAL